MGAMAMLSSRSKAINDYVNKLIISSFINGVGDEKQAS